MDGKKGDDCSGDTGKPEGYYGMLPAEHLVGSAQNHINCTSSLSFLNMACGHYRLSNCRQSNTGCQRRKMYAADDEDGGMDETTV